MFTLRSKLTPRALYKFATEWPFSGDCTRHEQPDLHRIEEQRKLNLLGPALSVVANANRESYATVLTLVQAKIDRVIQIATDTEVVVNHKKVPVILLLTESVLWKVNWSVTWHEQVSRIREFALANLTITKLQDL